MNKQGIPKSRLGRGLDSLMNVSPPEVEGRLASAEARESRSAVVATGVAGVQMLEVPVDRITANPHQPRRRFDEAALHELAESIKSTGLIQPVVARGTVEGGYELIAGERRWRAAKLAGLAALPVLVRSVDPVMQAQMALVENIHRQDLNPLERAAAYKALLDNLGLTQAELADRLGEDRSRIGHYLRLLDLVPPVQELVADGQVYVSQANFLAGVSDVAEQARLAELVVNQGLNLKNLTRLIGVPQAAPPTATSEPMRSAHLDDLEKNLSRQLGMRVQVRRSSQTKGRLVVHYGNLDQFDDLMSRLGVAAE